jgi:hypothetical protein
MIKKSTDCVIVVDDGMSHKSRRHSASQTKLILDPTTYLQCILIEKDKSKLSERL